MTNEEAIKILGLSRGFTQDDAKAAYRKLARKFHPDVAGQAFTKKFAQINEAYNIISNLGDNFSSCILTHESIFNVRRV